MITARFFFFTENVVQTCSSPNYALASKYLELWASALVRWTTWWPKKREKKKVAKMELRIFCKFILFFFPPIFFLTHFSNSGFGNCEQVSSPPLFAFVCPHRLCLPQVLKKILNVKQVFINLLVLKGSSVFVAQNYKCVKLINQL